MVEFASMKRLGHHERTWVSSGYLIPARPSVLISVTWNACSMYGGASGGRSSGPSLFQRRCCPTSSALVMLTTLHERQRLPKPSQRPEPANTRHAEGRPSDKSDDIVLLIVVRGGGRMAAIVVGIVMTTSFNGASCTMAI